MRAEFTSHLKTLMSLPVMDEERLFKKLFVFSVVGHVIFFTFDKLDFFNSTPEPLVEEWSIDTDLMTDNPGAVTETTLPKAVESDEVKVPDNLLPQLPKNFAIEQPKKADEDGEMEPLKNAKAGEAKPDQVDKAPDVKDDKQDATKVAMKEAMKRLALEKLRKEQKDVKGREYKAQRADAMARIRSELQAAKAGDAAEGAGGSGLEEKKYGALLKKAIQKHYSLPQTFTSNVASLKVILAITVDELGQLVNVRVQTSSNDPVFDEYSIRAAKAAAPYAKPPESQVGKEIHLVFSR